MSDLISREEAIEAIKQATIHSEDENLAIEALENLPSAERTGKWKYERHEDAPMLFKDRWFCSACGKSNAYGMSDFCPCCGAMMENSTRRTKEAENGE